MPLFCYFTTHITSHMIEIHPMRYVHWWLKLGGEVERLVEENRHVFGESAAFGGGWPAASDSPCVRVAAVNCPLAVDCLTLAQTSDLQIS